MDKQYIKENNIIDQYLRQELADDERQAFRVALLFDEELRQEVEDTRLLFQQLQGTASALTSPQSKNWLKWLLGALALGIILSLGYWMPASWFEQEPAPSMTTPMDSSKMEGPSQRIPTKEVETQPEKDRVPEEAPASTLPKASPKPKAKLKKTEPSQPIAAADSKPHPYLDQFTKAGFRSNGSTVRIRSPKMGQILPLKNGKIELHIEGTLALEEAPDEERFVIRLFSNKKADFDDFKPLFSGYPTLRAKGAEYELYLSQTLELSPGLYYFILEDNAIEDMIYVGKIKVQ